MKCRLPLSLAAVFWLMWIGETIGADAVLHGKIGDAITGRQTPCTVKITDANGKVVVESDSFKDGFRCSGEFTKRLPAGRTRIRITRGLETKAINREVNLVAGETRDLGFTLERVVNLRNRGWFAGDSHVHMPQLILGHAVGIQAAGQRPIIEDGDGVAVAA